MEDSIKDTVDCLMYRYQGAIRAEDKNGPLQELEDYLSEHITALESYEPNSHKMRVPAERVAHLELLKKPSEDSDMHLKQRSDLVPIQNRELARARADLKFIRNTPKSGYRWKGVDKVSYAATPLLYSVIAKERDEIAAFIIYDFGFLRYL
jgi:hypothetical protein